MGRRNPSHVRDVITLGTPVAARGDTARVASQTTDTLARRHLVPGPMPRPWREAGSLRVPVTAIHSRTEVFVPWQTSLVPAGARRRNLEVSSSHLGLIHNPAVLRVIGKALTQQHRS
jgi:hypothetical protein